MMALYHIVSADSEPPDIQTLVMPRTQDHLGSQILRQPTDIIKQFIRLGLLSHKLIESINGNVPVLFDIDVRQTGSPIDPFSGMQELEHQNDLGRVKNTKLFLECSQSAHQLVHLPTDHYWSQKIKIAIHPVHVMGQVYELVPVFKQRLNLLILGALGLNGEILAILFHFLEGGRHEFLNCNFLPIMTIEWLKFGPRKLVIHQVLHIQVHSILFGNPGYLMLHVLLHGAVLGQSNIIFKVEGHLFLSQFLILQAQDFQQQFFHALVLDFETIVVFVGYVEDKFAVLIASAEGYGLNSIYQNFASDGEFLVKIDQLRHHRLNKILTLLQIIDGVVSDHKNAWLTFIGIIEFHYFTREQDFLLLRQLRNETGLLAKGERVVAVGFHSGILVGFYLLLLAFIISMGRWETRQKNINHAVSKCFQNTVRGSYSVAAYFYQKNVFFIFYLISDSSTSYFKNFSKDSSYLSLLKWQKGRTGMPNSGWVMKENALLSTIATSQGLLFTMRRSFVQKPRSRVQCCRYNR